MKKIWQFVRGKVFPFLKAHATEIILFILGIVLGKKIYDMSQEPALTKKVEDLIQKAQNVGDQEKQAFRKQLDDMNQITDDQKRMEAKIRLRQSLLQ